MGQLPSHQLSAAQLTKHQSATGLSREQLEQLHRRFRELDRQQRGHLTPTELLKIPQLAQNPLHRQIVDGFFASGDRIDFDQFARTCATFLVPQFQQLPQQRADGRQQKLRLLCQMFDTRRGGCITRTDFQRAMKSFLDSLPSIGGGGGGGGDELPELQLIVEHTFGGSERISYELFQQRLDATDVEGRLAVSKWLAEEDGPQEAEKVGKKSGSGS